MLIIRFVFLCLILSTVKLASAATDEAERIQKVLLPLFDNCKDNERKQIITAPTENCRSLKNTIKSQYKKETLEIALCKDTNTAALSIGPNCLNELENRLHSQIWPHKLTPKASTESASTESASAESASAESATAESATAKAAPTSSASASASASNSKEKLLNSINFETITTSIFILLLTIFLWILLKIKSHLIKQHKEQIEIAQAISLSLREIKDQIPFTSETQNSLQVCLQKIHDELLEKNKSLSSQNSLLEKYLKSTSTPSPSSLPNRTTSENASADQQNPKQTQLTTSTTNKEASTEHVPRNAASSSMTVQTGSVPAAVRGMTTWRADELNTRLAAIMNKLLEARKGTNRDEIKSHILGELNNTPNKLLINSENLAIQLYSVRGEKKNGSPHLIHISLRKTPDSHEFVSPYPGELGVAQMEDWFEFGKGATSDSMQKLAIPQLTSDEKISCAVRGVASKRD